MVGGTLRDIRSHADRLSASDGPYAVVCDRLGREPLPLVGLRFGTASDAERAADAASDYRSALRRYDPQVPHHEPLVRRVADGTLEHAPPAEADARTRYFSFCHDVTGAVFESLSTTGHRGVESAAMETYLTLAEVVDDHDDFCLAMLWSVLSELDVRLDDDGQRTVVAEAASSLGDATTGAIEPEPTVGDALGATMARLEDASFVRGFDVSGVPGGDAWEVTFGGYALAERTGRLPTLPVAVDVVRRLDERSVAFTEATPLTEGRWRLRVEDGRDSAGLVSLNVTDEGRLNEADYYL
ncbi:DUF7551 domain-containing protein [Halogeometricum limi]|uniref:Uncharacterized protein n=1 Tax=Halogeometricum limi TaxID=555875 RepID=A0A1I6GVA5_9EURY|nr:hypothetical protein [Halogeometricum limi]SFR46213.1 hypothetical protein SAMN04488124_1589 [Halogeometricum limi]